MARSRGKNQDHRIADEHGTLYRRANREVVLCYPNTYRVAGASLGLQVIYRLLNSRPSVSCQRAVMPEELVSGGVTPVIRSLEHGMALDGFDAVLFSIAYELDIVHLAEMLQASRIPAFASERTDDDPPVIVGGPLTQSNVLPLGAFVDVVVMGEAEEAGEVLLDWFEAGLSRGELMALAAEQPGMWVPSIHGDAVPDVLAVYGQHIPARGAWYSPQAEFRDMALLEASRGCPRYCKFCVVRAPVSPMRSPALDRVVQALDEGVYRDAPRVGFVGAAVSDWPHIKPALRAALDRGKGLGISSLRADRLDEEFVDLLRLGGFRTMTVASDAASQRMRGKMMKGLRERHFLSAARLARAAGLYRLKMYVILGLPEEESTDLDELISMCLRMSQGMKMAITISPFVPKLHTPLAEAPFEAIASQLKKIKYVQRALGGKIEVRFDSPRWAWVEYRLSQGGIEAGPAAWKAWSDGGGYQAYKRAFARLDGDDEKQERAAVNAALHHDLWPVAGAR